MRLLRFPSDQIVGTLEWDGSWAPSAGPVLATGAIEVPVDTAIALEVAPWTGKASNGGGRWTMTHGQTLVDLDFLRELPGDAIESLSIQSADESTFGALAHLADGLRRLTLSLTGFSDAVVSVIAQLTQLTQLQTFGNQFTDAAVQQLCALQRLEHLYLEEQTLTVAGFGFASQLPRLSRLGLQDVPLRRGDLEQLRAQLPGVDVG